MLIGLIWGVADFPVNVGFREVVNVVGALIIVSFLSYLILKIYGNNRSGPCYRGIIKVVDGISLGARTSIYIIKVLDEYILIGVTDKNITTISKLENLSEEQFSQLNRSGGFVGDYAGKVSFNKVFHNVLDTFKKGKKEEKGKGLEDYQDD